MRDISLTASSFHEFQVALRRSKELVQRESDIWRLRKFGYFKAYAQAKLCLLLELDMPAFDKEQHCLLFHRAPIGGIDRNFINSYEPRALPAQHRTSTIYDEADRMLIVAEGRYAANEIVSTRVAIPSLIWLLKFERLPELFGVPPLAVLQSFPLFQNSTQVGRSGGPREIPTEHCAEDAGGGDIGCLIEAVSQMHERTDRTFFDRRKRVILEYLKLKPPSPGAFLQISDNGIIPFRENIEKSGLKVRNVSFCPTDRLLGRPEVRNIRCIHD